MTSHTVHKAWLIKANENPFSYFPHSILAFFFCFRAVIFQSLNLLLKILRGFCLVECITEYELNAIACLAKCLRYLSLSDIYILQPKCQFIWKSNNGIEAIYENSFRINQIVINDDDDLYEAENNIVPNEILFDIFLFLFCIYV